MGLQHEEFIPRSFVAAMSGNYLGSQQVVGHLVAWFLAQTEDALQRVGAGELVSSGFESEQGERIRRMADVFAGRDPRFAGIAGWNGISLDGRLQADLGDFWGKRQERWGGDACSVFFEWLTVMFADRWKTAAGDDTVLLVSLRPLLQQAVAKLTGAERRG